MIDVLLKNAKCVHLANLVDVAIEKQKILAVSDSITMDAKQVIDLEGRLLLPGFVDSHVHLDIALMNAWDAPGRPEPFLSHKDLNASLERRRKHFTPEDIENRASQALTMALRHGVTAMRVQCHVDLDVGLSHAQVLKNVKHRFADLIDLQIVGFPQQGLLRSKNSVMLFQQAFDLGLLDVMGCASNLDNHVHFRDHIEQALNLALQFNVDLDAHVDLGLHTNLSWEQLEVVYLARRVGEYGHEGRVTAGHVSSLDSLTPDEAELTIDLIKDAEISVISQPDLYRLGRDDQQHVRRGLTCVKKLLAAGVNVTFASNNVRDELRPMGNFNPLEEALILAYGAHMDTIDELNTLIDMCTYNAAKALGLNHYGLDAGCNANLVVLDAPSPSAAIIDQAEQRYVFKDGRLLSSSYVVSERYY